jgi:hypothetical protein
LNPCCRRERPPTLLLDFQQYLIITIIPKPYCGIICGDLLGKTGIPRDSLIDFPAKIPATLFSSIKKPGFFLARLLPYNFFCISPLMVVVFRLFCFRRRDIF